MPRDLEGFIESVCEFEGADLLWYMARGHVDKEAFRNECRIEFGQEMTLDQISHHYARNVPSGIKGQHLIYLAKRKGRGAYPITYFDVLRYAEYPLSLHQSVHKSDEE